MVHINRKLELEAELGFELSILTGDVGVPSDTLAAQYISFDKSCHHPAELLAAVLSVEPPV